MKILIADDELPIREWLTFSVKAAAPEAELLSPASDGREALETVRAQHPELVFVDIKMPLMDGLTLLRHIKELDPSIYVVMLTSYSDFDYAREALQAKADEYVLKSEITQEGLKQILSAYEQTRAARDEGISRVYLRDVLAGTAQWSPLEQSAGEDVFAIAYAVAGTQTEQGNFESHYNSFVQDVAACPYDENVMVLLCRCAQNISTGTTFQETMRFCRSIVSLRQASVGFSGVVQDTREACRRALDALCIGFYEESPTVLAYTAPDAAWQEQQEALRKKTVSALYKGHSEEAAQLVEEILSQAAKARSTALMALRSTMTDIISAYKLSLIEFSNPQMEQLCQTTKEAVQTCACFSELQQVMHRFLTQCGTSVYVKGVVRSEHIKEALAYTIEHYAAISTISEVAAHINLNTEYFCRLFKAETGETFNQYLTDLRIKKAVELLSHTDMRVYEVAQAVGYGNLSYFSRVFKKYTGENPFAQKK